MFTNLYLPTEQPGDNAARPSPPRGRTRTERVAGLHCRSDTLGPVDGLNEAIFVTSPSPRPGHGNRSSSLLLRSLPHSHATWIVSTDVIG